MPEMGRYGFGRLTVDGREETRDVIVLPEHIVRGWRRTKGPRSSSRISTKCSKSCPSACSLAPARTGGCGPTQERSRRYAPAASNSKYSGPVTQSSDIPNLTRRGRRPRCI
jgi:hypothetical protein